MGYQKCKKCGYENDIDAKFCEKCGTPLNNSKTLKNPQSRGMSTTTKFLIVFCIVLVAALGITVGILFQMNKDTTPSTNNSLNTSSQNSSAQATWHKIATYSNGYSNHGSVYDVNIRADNVRVTFSGTPVKNNIGMPSQLKITALKYIEAEGAVTFAGQGELNWGSELQSKENSFEFTTTSRKIQIQVTPTQLENWELNVWNYY